MNLNPLCRLLFFILSIEAASALHSFGQEKEWSAQEISDFLTHPKNESLSPSTGDILVWANTSMDSLIIQELTDGRYSHCGLVYKDENDEVWILDAFPRFGLRFMRLKNYLEPRGTVKLINVGLLRYKEPINIDTVNQYVHELIRMRDHVIFDKFMILDIESLELKDLENNSIKLYCCEMIYWIFRQASDTENFFSNDYDRVMTKWALLASKAKDGVGPIDLVKLFYIKLYLNKLRAHPRKILITPNGMIRSGSFEIIQEITNMAQPAPLKKSLASLPEITPSESSS